MISAAFLDDLRAVVGNDHVVHEAVPVMTYECDALAHLRVTPAAVVLPGSAAEVQGVVQLCARDRVPFVARGHGTGLSGGALPVKDGIVIALTRLNRVLNVDIANQRVTVEPGVTNLEITRQVAPFGFYYAPDPSSQQICSIGGNVAENSGGAHCLKYGFTTHHVLSVDAVFPDGSLIRIDGAVADAPGPDLLGLLIGSEGTLAVVTSVDVRITRRAECVQTLLAAFDTIEAGGEAVSDIISAGIVPAAVEMMDAMAIQAAEAAVHPGFPPANTILIVELDGPRAEVDALLARVEDICRQRGTTHLEVAQSDDHRARIWKGRKAAFAAMGRISPQLLRAGRGRAPFATAGGPASNQRAVGIDGPANRERLSRRRWQSAPADLV